MSLAFLIELTICQASFQEANKQRVAIARALINKPKIILADEPTGNLDGENSQIMMKLLLDYTKKSKTSLILVTHDTSLAQRCDRIIELNDGNIV